MKGKTPAMKLKLFLEPSKAIASRLTEAFDFVWPTAAAIWNLRWQVQGITGAFPDMSEADLQGRFTNGSGIRGANLRRSCIDITWQEQQEQFAKFLLFEFCALYETWCEMVVDQLALNASLKKELQFPTSLDALGVPIKGVGLVMRLLASHPSPVFATSIQPSLASNRKYSPTHLEELLKCYRYFKELRNCLIHGSPGPSAMLKNAEATYACLNASSLGLTQCPEHIPSVDGIAPKLSLRGVSGFGEVVLKLVCTIDITVAGTAYAERDFKRRWKDKHGSSAKPVAARGDSRRRSRIQILTKKLGLPNPFVDQALVDWLKAESLIFF